MELRDFQYLLLLGACVAITLPLEFVLGARVWRQPRRLLAALWIPVVLFVIWDIAAIARDHWTYNPAYVTGWRLPGKLPVEELVFFVVIPIASLLTYEAVGRVLRREVRLPGRDSAGQPTPPGGAGAPPRRGGGDGGPAGKETQ
ncbi:MAG: lycopene cyclase domain-containing protein [Acidimicrobiales bacterium]|nr:lycopene cyclase domain-containing protein [Actinomycetota bacterium]